MAHRHDSGEEAAALTTLIEQEIPALQERVTEFEGDRTALKTALQLFALPLDTEGRRDRIMVTVAIFA